MHIIGINGAPNRDGAVSRLLDEALAAAAVEDSQVSTSRVDLIDLSMPYHDGAYDKTPPELAAVFEEMRAADGFIFATPVNWFNVSALMKCFIDWLTTLEDRYELEGKVAGVVVHCNADGGNQAAMNIVAPLLHMGLMIPPYCAFFRNVHVGEKSEERWMMTDQALVGKNVVRLAKQVADKGVSWNLS